MNRKPILVLLSVIALIAACQKDDDAPPVLPVSEPLTVAAAKPGDTLYIKGQNFSDALEKNTVKFNGVAGTVVVASATELKVVVPANATSGAITVTVNGQTIEVGSISIVPFTLFVYKRDYRDQDNEIRQIYVIDPATGQETLFYTLQDADGHNLDDMVYLPATNELVALTGKNDDVLFRLNITSKQATYTPMQAGANADFMELVVDKFSNLYTVKRNWSDPNHYMQSLVKVDPKTGAYSAVKTFEYGAYWESLVYVPATDEVVGLTEGNAVLKLSLTSKDTSRVHLPTMDLMDYAELTIDNKSNLYVLQRDWSDPDNGVGQIYQLNPTNYQSTWLTMFDDYTNVRTNMVYLPNRNEIATIWDDGSAYSLYKLKVDTKASSPALITNQRENISYRDLTSN